MRRPPLSLLLASLVFAACSSPTPPPKPPDPDPDPEPARPPPPEPDAAPQEPVDPDRDPAAPENVAAIPDDATTTESGVGYKIIDAGDGKGQKPGPRDRVKVHYTGWTTDGHRFDSSIDREPAVFPLETVIPGWKEGMQLIGVGQKARLWIPESLAYNGRPGSPQGMLVFDVEILEVLGAPTAPDDVAAPPKKAKKTRKGVRYMVLKKGARGDPPALHDRVEVHYSGWTTDGKLFDSSLSRGRPATFGLNQVIAGWTDVVGLMTVGAKWRVWIPEELAYKGKEGRPQGMLVFEIELLSIEKQPAPPKAPKDVKRAPRSAKKTRSGLRYQFISDRVEDGEVAEEGDQVEVHYTGWTTDGKMFDSSVTRGKPETFALGSVVAGFREGILLMHTGEKIRLWIPKKLAYDGKPGAPEGTLVFDIELLGVTPALPEVPTEID